MTRTPVVLIHGTWLHATSWQQWVPRLRTAGFEAEITAWPGEPDTAVAARRRPHLLAHVGLRALIGHHERLVRSLPAPPVVIGHSVGGLIAQHLLATEQACAAVGIAAIPPEAIPWDGSRLLIGETDCRATDPVVSPAPRLFRQRVASAVSEQEAPALFERFAVPAPRRLLTELGAVGAAGRVALGTEQGASTRGPLLLLLISGQEDRLVTDAAVRANYKLHGDSTAITDLKQFPDRGHSLIVDSRWRAVADHVIDWLRLQDGV